MNSVVGAFRFAFSFPLSPLPPPVNRLAAHITGALSYPQPLKTQSLKNKYMMPRAVKQVGVVAV